MSAGLSCWRYSIVFSSSISDIPISEDKKYRLISSGSVRRIQTNPKFSS